MDLPKVSDIKTRPGHKLWLRFSDGTEGTVDLSDLVGKGVFEKWKDAAFFNSARIDADSGAVAWPGGIDLAPDSLYEDLTGKSLFKSTHA
ncbi:MAG: hypothetical protein AUJ52_13055 [Elusimicrobia bacterium CG1_02_63_36]|nr:MAG: hypothetical protein AUJ52_13055 [Elusimicrobia bacterium CG1_02_63_36]PIP83914.1 MAG: hypothetical protein COR54_06930 [Elusimicrobia bacterium CG22_combo_CG10-13_8_21_14_all_63_91]PJA11753.1 MAG: DUF2442 domain-containing protein [Elusimicrobia bacterium CG_4_10_14_0_2_um_filter_63_34]PJB24124.1 MAG: DUF2442 domain-containing protein [Elusimicrobia bacterium CG_4_9_14_3_um_filter_62_55]